MPIVAIEVDLLSIKLASKSPRSLRIAMTFKAQYSQIRLIIVTRVINNMMYLNFLPGYSANTARTIRREQNLCSICLRYWHAPLGHIETPDMTGGHCSLGMKTQTSGQFTLA